MYEMLTLDASITFIADIDDCASKPCQPNGRCIDGVNNYTCKCDPGYTGKHCEKGKQKFKFPSS